MANYYGTGRTNYFKVKNEEKFLNWVAGLSGTEAHKGKRKKEFCLLFVEEDGDTPSSQYNEDKDEYEDFDFVDGLAKHLSKHAVAVIVHSGAEKHRYVGGYSLAVNAKGKYVRIELADIYNKAATLTKKPMTITPAEY